MECSPPSAFGHLHPFFPGSAFSANRGWTDRGRNRPASAFRLQSGSGVSLVRAIFLAGPPTPHARGTCRDGTDVSQTMGRTGHLGGRVVRTISRPVANQRSRRARIILVGPYAPSSGDLENTRRI